MPRPRTSLCWYQRLFRKGARVAFLEDSAEVRNLSEYSALLTSSDSIRDNKSSLLGDSRHLQSKLLKPHVEMIVSTTSLAVSMICAGSGDLDVLRIVRELRWKIDELMYGSHVALSMSLGFLFLSGGEASLKRDDTSIACLLMATLPRFPYRTADHQYHLQPLRHLWALATEKRILIAEDVDSGESLRIPVHVRLIDGQELALDTPCLLPELSTVKRIFYSPRFPAKYYEASVDMDTKRRRSLSLPLLLLLKRVSGHFQPLSQNITLSENLLAVVSHEAMKVTTVYSVEGLG